MAYPSGATLIRLPPASSPFLLRARISILGRIRNPTVDTSVHGFRLRSLLSSGPKISARAKNQPHFPKRSDSTAFFSSSSSYVGFSPRPVCHFPSHNPSQDERLASSHTPGKSYRKLPGPSFFSGVNSAIAARPTTTSAYVTSAIAGSESSAATNGAIPTASNPFSEDLSKAFNFEAEEAIYAWWEENGYFNPERVEEALSKMREEEGEEEGGVGRKVAEEEWKDAFVVAMPPPNVTGALHMGHAMFVTLEDIMVRYWRMRGRRTLWVPGADHAGIATQLVVEKMLSAEGVKRTELGREEFVRRVWEWKEKYGGTIAQQIRRLGASCDWTREHFTLDSQLSKAVVEAFSRLHEKGLIYRGTYMVNWSPFLQTAVSDLEVEYSEEPGMLYYFKYPIAGGAEDEYLPVATTRPETILGDTALAVHPEDERYSRFVGQMAEVPLSGNRQIPIVADEYVDREFGTGALKITPGHDVNDYAIGERLHLPIINLMNKDASLNENAGPYQNMDRFEARKLIWKHLEEAGLAIDQKPHISRVPRSQRGGEVVEPMVSRQWFVRMDSLAKNTLAAVDNKELSFIPERFEKVYKFWLENIRDWCISRQLWWGHRIPVWYVEGSHEGGEGGGGGGAAGEEDFIVARSEEEARAKAEEKHGKGVVIHQDPDVLDTWFSSGLWPFSTLGWPDESAPDFQKYYPTAVMETGHDILFFWVARMAMMGLELTGKLPFSTVYLHGLVRDSQGRKMSKSLGNVIDPLDSISQFGSDALRFTLATGTTPGQDVNLSTERLGANKAFTNKLWNAAKFILQNLPDKSDAARWQALSNVKFDTPESVATLPLAERWIVSRLHGLVDNATAAYSDCEFGTVGRDIYDFFWNDFADWYIEASKTRIYGKKETVDVEARMGGVEVHQKVLVYVFGSVLKLLHPFMPYVSEQLWQALPHKGVALIIARWPATKCPRDLTAEEDFANIQDLVRAIRNVRAEYAVEPAKRIEATITSSDRFFHPLTEERAVVMALARLDADAFNILPQPPQDASESVHIVVREGVEAYVPLKGMVDIVKEMDRIKKQMAKASADLDSCNKRLSAKKFVEKAPVDVVEGVRASAKEAEEKLSILSSRLCQLEAMVSPAQ